MRRRNRFEDQTDPGGVERTDQRSAEEVVARLRAKKFRRCSEIFLTVGKCRLLYRSAIKRARSSGVFFLARREPLFAGLNEWAFLPWSGGEQLIFDSAILDFVITTIEFFEIQKVEVSEN